MAAWPNWIRRLPTEQKIVGSSPTVVIFILFCFNVFGGLQYLHIEFANSKHMMAACRDKLTGCTRTDCSNLSKMMV